MGLRGRHTSHFHFLSHFSRVENYQTFERNLWKHSLLGILWIWKFKFAYILIKKPDGLISNPVKQLQFFVNLLKRRVGNFVLRNYHTRINKNLIFWLGIHITKVVYRIIFSTEGAFHLLVKWVTIACISIHCYVFNGHHWGWYCMFNVKMMIWHTFSH